ncbi:MAG: aldo/keto reductase [Candidatus Thorarchaeota archaeon]
MKIRKLGRSGIEVSEIGIGTEYLYKIPKKMVTSVINEAIKNDINYFDIVFNVSNYIENLSYAFKDYIEDITIACHLGSIEKEGKVQRTRNIDYCEKAILKTIKKFGKGYIDIVNLQFVKEKEYEKIITSGGLIDLAKRLQKEGKARFLGLSTHNTIIGQKAAKTGEFDMIMNQISIANDLLPGREDFLKLCKNKGIGVVAIKPFAGGKLLQRNRTVSIAKYQSGGISWKKKIPRDITPIKCINYTLSQTGVSTTVPGVKNVEELKEILNFVNASSEEKDFSFVLREFNNNLT